MNLYPWICNAYKWVTINLGTLVYARTHIDNKLCHNPLCVGTLGEAKVCFYVESIPHKLCINLSGEAKICYYFDSNSHIEMIHTDDAHKGKGPQVNHLSISLQ